MASTPRPRLFKDRKVWRTWLRKNHRRSDGIWIVYFKKHTGKKSITHAEAVEEALCFGWIDSQVRRMDDERYQQRFTPRRRGSVWSLINKESVIRLIKQGKMTKALLLRR